MFRIIAVGSAPVVRAAAPLALLPFAPVELFASAHTIRHAEAKAQPGNKLPDTSRHGETVTFRHRDTSGDPTGPLLQVFRC